MNLTDLHPLLLVQHGKTLLKISTVHDNRVTAQVLYEPGRSRLARTAVRTYPVGAVQFFREPSAQILNKYEDTYGQRAERTS